MNKNSPYKIFVIDDQPVFIAGLTVIIERVPGLKVSGSASSWDTIPPDLVEDPPDLFILEIFLRKSDGFGLLKQLRRHFPNSAVLVYSIQDEAVCGERALQSGAKGYLMKSDNLEIIHQAIRRLAEGHLYLSNRLQSLLFNGRTLSPSPTDNFLINSLTNKELQVVQFIGQGRSNTEIATAMKLRVKTVEAHRSRIKKKLHLKHSTELIRYAVQYLGASYPKANSF